ncbi:Alpha-L-Rha alpha-1,3-L-rhamnosyltransferase [hydrothermal vent metagenome]|uniref:Alpha-L-Rha alpha-1,3-L-rhamnosyltransferase n=1 Tax=hydrothermal vent metagenome TaxID=652676 RepID=A0A3B0T5X2_9ZZZZ
MTDRAPHITIALCTHNGAAHLREQLDSYLAQSHENWRLWVSDDGSTDDTRAILKDFATRHGGPREIRIIDGPNQGATANYISLLCHPEFPAGAVALSDQDDVWLEDKLTRAVQGLAQSDAPLLYGAQSVLTDAALRPIGASKPGPCPPGFGNALVQNIVSGHSAALNPSALALVRRAGVPEHVPFHDWWLYQLITGAGGRVIIDPAQVLLYRQHRDNTVGARHGLRAHMRRMHQVGAQQFKTWTSANTMALKACEALLTPQARATLESFTQPRRGPARALQLRALGVHRQHPLATAGLYLAAMLGRV